MHEHKTQAHQTASTHLNLSRPHSSTRYLRRACQRDTAQHSNYVTVRHRHRSQQHAANAFGFLSASVCACRAGRKLIQTTTGCRMYACMQAHTHNKHVLSHTHTHTHITHLLAVVAASIVPLCCHNGLDGVEDVVLVYIAKRVCQAWECVLIPVMC